MENPCRSLSHLSLAIEWTNQSHWVGKVTPEKKNGENSRIWFKILRIFCSGFSFEVCLTHIFDGKAMTAHSHASRCNASRSPLLNSLMLIFSNLMWNDALEMLTKKISFFASPRTSHFTPEWLHNLLQGLQFYLLMLWLYNKKLFSQ